MASYSGRRGALRAQRRYKRMDSAPRRRRPAISGCSGNSRPVRGRGGVCPDDRRPIPPAI